jgi:hypothetical protein
MTTSRNLNSSLATIMIWLAAGLSGQALAQTGSPLRLAEKSGRQDVYGDPLPDGALARLGTIRFREYYRWRRHELADGQTTLIGTPRQIRWMDSRTGRQIKAVAIEKGLRPAGFSDDGRLAVLTDLTELYLFDLAAGKMIRKFPPHKEKGQEVFAHFSPDNGIVAIRTRYMYSLGFIRTMDVDQGTELWELWG